MYVNVSKHIIILHTYAIANQYKIFFLFGIVYTTPSPPQTTQYQEYNKCLITHTNFLVFPLLSLYISTSFNQHHLNIIFSNLQIMRIWIESTTCVYFAIQFLGYETVWHYLLAQFAESRVKKYHLINTTQHNKSEGEELVVILYIIVEDDRIEVERKKKTIRYRGRLTHTAQQIQYNTTQ